MIEVSILLSVINHMGRNVASIFCHEIIKKFPAEPLAANRGNPVENHCHTVMNLQFTPVPSPRGGFWGLSPPKQSSKPPQFET